MLLEYLFFNDTNYINGSKLDGIFFPCGCNHFYSLLIKTFNPIRDNVRNYRCTMDIGLQLVT